MKFPLKPPMCGLRLLACVFDFMQREKQTYRREPRAVGGGIESSDVGLSFTYTVNEHTFQRGNNSLKQFLLVLWSILICWDCELVGSQTEVV